MKENLRKRGGWWSPLGKIFGTCKTTFQGLYHEKHITSAMASSSFGKSWLDITSIVVRNFRYCDINTSTSTCDPSQSCFPPKSSKSGLKNIDTVPVATSLWILGGNGIDPRVLILGLKEGWRLRTELPRLTVWRFLKTRMLSELLFFSYSSYFQIIPLVMHAAPQKM